jgi:hypothetical protein
MSGAEEKKQMPAKPHSSGSAVSKCNVPIFLASRLGRACPDFFDFCYRSRNASVGSIRRPRRAGPSAAGKPTAIMDRGELDAGERHPVRRRIRKPCQGRSRSPRS